MNQLLENLLNTSALLAVFGCLVFSMDDLFLDLVAFLARLKPHQLTEQDLFEIHNQSQKRIAVMVANWHEEDVIERMVLGNLGAVSYSNYCFFLGVYPNDLKTCEKALSLSKRFTNVFTVVNSVPGPTSKGQMLNQIITRIRQLEFESQTHFDLVLMQDSEDVLHPLSLKLLNWGSKDFDFIQVPVFSFNLPLKKIVGSTYIDEFSEVHTKDLLVRQFLGCSIPSAGVGTAFSRRMIEIALNKQNGSFFPEDTLVEDYFLGTQTKKWGLKSTFLCAFRKIKSSGRRDFIATREYFPSKLRTAVKQKTRWTLGIAIQGLLKLGWWGNFMDRYFLARDRKGPLNAVLMTLSLVTFLTFIVCRFFNFKLPSMMIDPLFIIGAELTLLSMLIRIVQRMRAVSLVNGWQQALMVPIRWPVGNLINTLAAFQAIRRHIESVYAGMAPTWDKTAHELPPDFGNVISMPDLDSHQHAPAEASL